MPQASSAWRAKGAVLQSPSERRSRGAGDDGACSDELVVREARGRPAGDPRVLMRDSRYWRIAGSGSSFDELMIDDRTAEAYRSVLGRDQQPAHVQLGHDCSIESRRSRDFLERVRRCRPSPPMLAQRHPIRPTRGLMLSASCRNCSVRFSRSSATVRACQSCWLRRYTSTNRANGSAHAANSTAGCRSSPPMRSRRLTSVQSL